jgi:hypothetical protein
MAKSTLSMVRATPEGPITRPSEGIPVIAHLRWMPLGLTARVKGDRHRVDPTCRRDHLDHRAQDKHRVDPRRGRDPPLSGSARTRSGLCRRAGSGCSR